MFGIPRAVASVVDWTWVRKRAAVEEGPQFFAEPRFAARTGLQANNTPQAARVEFRAQGTVTFASDRKIAVICITAGTECY
jgi:hypothetical protein